MKNFSYGLFFKALSNDTRLKILNSLRKKDHTVTQLVKSLNLEQSRISHALKCLTNCAFVKFKPNGAERVYSINKKNVDALFKIVDKHVKEHYKELKSCRVLRK